MTIKMIISHGDKGGCGKSTVATIIGSELLRREIPFLLIEADAGETAGQADVGPRFSKRPGVTVMTAPLSSAGKDAEDTVARMFDLIEASGQETVLMNAPANASETLEAIGDLFVAVAEEMKIDLRVAYSLDRSSQAMKNAEKAAQGSVLPYATHAALIRNEYNGPKSEYDARFAKIKALKDMPKADVPRLSTSAADELLNHAELNLVELTTAGETPLSTARRIQVGGWFKQSAENLFDAILPELQDKKGK